MDVSRWDDKGKHSFPTANNQNHEKLWHKKIYLIFFFYLNVIFTIKHSSATISLMNGNVMEMMTEVMVAIFFQPVGTYIEYKIWKKKKNFFNTFPK